MCKHTVKIFLFEHPKIIKEVWVFFNIVHERLKEEVLAVDFYGI